MCFYHPAADIDHTYKSPMGGTSILDHFIVSENLMKCIMSYNVRHDGDNLSYHNAIQLCIDVQAQHLPKPVSETSFTPRPAWHKATAEDVSNYKRTLRSHLNNIVLPQELLSCNNVQCNEHYDIIDQYCNDIVFACIESTRICIPTPRKTKQIAGWSENVKPYKDKSVFLA